MAKNQIIPIDIPDNTESLHNIGEFIMSYQPYQNAFLNALVNRIGRTIITSKMWNNPWSRFKKGYLEFGETVEEIFVNIAKPHGFDPEKAESEIFKRELPDVRAAFHTMNFQKYYKVTISNDQLRQAFLSWQGITDLIAKIVDSLYTGMEKDEYLVMKYMLAREALNGGMYEVVTPDYEGAAANPKAVIAAYREYTNNLTILKSEYNRAHVETHTPANKQVIIVPNHAESVLGVEVLAAAFNMSQVDYIGNRVMVDEFSFSASDTARLALLFEDDKTYKPLTQDEVAALAKISAIKVDEDWWMVFDNFENFTQNYNGQGLYWQYWYHTWKTFSVSPYANAIVFTSQASDITGVTVSPASANVAQGSDLMLTATVNGTGLIDKTVVWSIEGQLKSGTTIDPQSGRLHIAKDETASTEITVTATAVDGTEGTSTITVVAS